MVKVTAPMFSLDASGRFAKAITYCKVGPLNYVRKLFFSPHYYLSSFNTNNYHFQNAVKTWQIFQPERKINWNNFSSLNYPQWSGFNAFTHFYIQALHDGNPPPFDPPF